MCRRNRGLCVRRGVIVLEETLEAGKIDKAQERQPRSYLLRGS